MLNVPLTYDEATSHYKASYREFINMHLVTANVHILNSILRKFFVETFIDNTFFLRFDNLIAQLAFLIFSWLLCKDAFRNIFWRISIFMLLNLNPFAFEFWGLSRGYGLATAFMLMSMYYIYRYIQIQHTRLEYLSLACAGLAVYSNFTLLNFYFSLCLVILIEPYLRSTAPKPKLSLQKIKPVLICSLVLLALITWPLYKLVKQNQFFYGGDTGFFQDTVISLVKMSIYAAPPNQALVKIIAYVIVGSFITIGIFWAYTFFKKERKPVNMHGIISYLLLAFCCIAIVLQHWLTGTKYLLDRTGIFLITLYTWQLGCFLHYFGSSKYTPVITGAIVFCSGLNFFKNLNFDQTQLWWFNKYDRLIVNRIISESNDGRKKINLRTDWLFSLPMNQDISIRYPGRIEKIEWIDHPPNRDTFYDYYYISSSDVKYVSPRYKIDTCLLNGLYCLLKKE